MASIKIIVRELLNMESKNLIQGGRPILKRSDLHGYQDRAVQFVKDNHGSALFLDMGL